MKEIICSGGEVIQVDDGDYELLSRHKWHFTANGAGTRSYAVTRLNTNLTKNVRTIFMHTMIMGFGFNYDHVDNNTQNNQKSNLRKATWSENGWNKGKPKGNRFGANSSQYKGVNYCPYKGKDRWVVIISLGKGKTPFRSGYFFNEVDAAKFYNKKIVELRGEFAWQNPIPNKSLEEK